MTEWPDGIPFFDLRSGYGARPGENVMRTPMDVGPAKLRRRTTSAPGMVTGLAYMTREEAQRFEEWWRVTLFDGALPFTKYDGLWKRRNLLVQSEDFSGAGWSRSADGAGSAPVVTPNAAASPFGPMTANRAQFALNGGSTTADRSFLTRSGMLGGTLSAWMRSSDTNTYQIRFRLGSVIIAQVTPQWQRFAVTNSSDVDQSFAIGIRGVFTSNDTADILLWGVQMEAGTRATAYEPVGPFYRENDLTRGGTKSYRFVGVPRFDLMGLGHRVPVTLEVMP